MFFPADCNIQPFWPCKFMSWTVWKKTEEHQDDKLRKIMQELLSDPCAHNGFSLNKGRLYCKERLVVSDAKLKPTMVNIAEQKKEYEIRIIRMLKITVALAHYCPRA